MVLNSLCELAGGRSRIVTKGSERGPWGRAALDSQGGEAYLSAVIDWRSRLRGECRRYVCLRTYRRQIRAYASAMLANRPARGNHETQRISQPQITRTSDRLA